MTSEAAAVDRAEAAGPGPAAGDELRDEVRGPTERDGRAAEDVRAAGERVAVLLGNAQVLGNRLEASRVRERELHERVDQLTAALATAEQQASAARESARVAAASAGEAAGAAAERIGLLERELATARRCAALWERRYTLLRGRLPIRLAAQVGGTLRAAVGSARHRPDS